MYFFYFSDELWHPRQRLIFNYSAADSRTRNTFMTVLERPEIQNCVWDFSKWERNDKGDFMYNSLVYNAI